MFGLCLWTHYQTLLAFWIPSNCTKLTFLRLFLDFHIFFFKNLINSASLIIYLFWIWNQQVLSYSSVTERLAVLAGKVIGCRTTKRRHLATFCISFLWQRGTCPENRKDYYLKKSHLAVFCIDGTAIGCYDFVRTPRCATEWKVS